MQLSARVIAVTQPLEDTKMKDSEQLLAFCARVSNPSNQNSHHTAKRLLDYRENKHWSVFEMANAVVAIEEFRYYQTITAPQTFSFLILSKIF